MYVMTSEYGAASQLEKIDMLDFADLAVVNKFEKRGAEDALRDVRKQWRRNRVAFTASDDQVPVYPTIASRFNDGRQPPLPRLRGSTKAGGDPLDRHGPGPEVIERHALFGDACATGRDSTNGRRAHRRRHRSSPRLEGLQATCRWGLVGAEHWALRATALADDADSGCCGGRLQRPLKRSCRWLRPAAAVADDVIGHRHQFTYTVRGGNRGATVPTLSRNRVLARSAPFRDWGEQLVSLGEPSGALRAGVPYRREEDPTRMFAGEAVRRTTGSAVAGGHGAASLDGLRFDDALRRGPRRAAGHLRPHRQLRRIHRNPR
jgi:methylmalonyl-CoA mutase